MQAAVDVGVHVPVYGGMLAPPPPPVPVLVVPPVPLLLVPPMPPVPSFPLLFLQAPANVR